MKENSIKPWHTACFILLILLLFGAVGYFNPKNEWRLSGGVVLRAPVWRPWEDFQEEKAAKARARQDSLAEWAVRDSLLELGITPPPVARKGEGLIQFAPGDSMGFAKLVLQLEKAKKGESIRVLHYGDSQIEGDRITGDVRDALQQVYGGEGPGLQPLVPFVPMSAVEHSATGDWTRMVSFGRANSKNPSNQYGIRGIAHRFNVSGTGSTSASVSLRPRTYGFTRARRSRKFTLFHGPVAEPLEIKWFANDTLWKVAYLEAGRPEGSLTVQSSQPVQSLHIEFNGQSPDFYGLAMDGAGGVSVDNIAMRGADGLSFSRMDRNHFIRSLREQQVGLVILQFGGNSVPYFRSYDAVQRYGESFRRQIQLFKAALPDADILVVGPSDMATKEGVDWVSYPYVDDVRDVLKEAAFEEGAGFFDVMTFMGGEGSMAEWVEASPALAGPDHIHFTPNGAKKVASALAEALIDEIDRHE